MNNEFALVHLEIDRSANGERLKITSKRTGRSRSLDPLMLEVLTWLPIEHLTAALETPFGPEPELGVVRPPEQAPDNYHEDPGRANGVTKADVR